MMFMSTTDDIGFVPDFQRALAYFETLLDYRPTPLLHVAGPNGQDIIVKDETDRMSLGAFKALGGPYAIARLLHAEWLKRTGEDLTPTGLADADFRAFTATKTFVCASAGNHGIGVAKGANALGANARIYLADTVPQNFDARLKMHNAQVVRAGETYEDSVEEAVTDARRTGAVLLADGTWPGYTEIPKLVMEGYTVIAEELRAAFEASGNWPTHVYLQAGVGGLAAAMAHMIRLNWAEQPKLIIVEPAAAPCLQASHHAGTPIRVEGPTSNMGSLDCKEPSLVAWHVLQSCDVTYDTLSETQGDAGVAFAEALGIATTPSGAAGLACLQKQYPSSGAASAFRPLVIVTEGPT